MYTYQQVYNYEYIDNKQVYNDVHLTINWCTLTTLTALAHIFPYIKYTFNEQTTRNSYIVNKNIISENIRCYIFVSL